MYLRNQKYRALEGLSQHTLEVETFLRSNNIDVLLIAETHCTQKHHFFIKGYSFYQTMHPNGKAHGGSAILIKSKIHHYCIQQILSTNVIIDGWIGELQISAIYSPPKDSVKRDDYELLLSTLGNSSLAKHF